MSSLKQQEANRLNAQKSAGPRTLAGKAVSRFNALKSGIDAEAETLPFAAEEPEPLQPDTPGNWLRSARTRAAP
jgi:hypothetical protein